MLSFPICRTVGEGCRPVGFFATRPLSTASYRRPRRWSGTLPFSKPTSCELSAAEQEWLKKLPEAKKPIYSHSLPCIEAWLKNLGFSQSAEDRALWYAERPDWHAQLSLDVTDLYISFVVKELEEISFSHREGGSLIGQPYHYECSIGSFSKPTSCEFSAAEQEWLKKLSEEKKPIYSHSLPCIEAWLKNLRFSQSVEDCVLCYVERLDWHAQLSLDVIDLYIRYLKSGPGKLEKDVERRFSYALSREDIKNAILGGP